MKDSRVVAAPTTSAPTSLRSGVRTTSLEPTPYTPGCTAFSTISAPLEDGAQTNPFPVDNLGGQDLYLQKGPVRCLLPSKQFNQHCGNGKTGLWSRERWHGCWVFRLPGVKLCWQSVSLGVRLYGCGTGGQTGRAVLIIRSLITSTLCWLSAGVCRVLIISKTTRSPVPCVPSRF